VCRSVGDGGGLPWFAERRIWEGEKSSLYKPGTTDRGSIQLTEKHWMGRTGHGDLDLQGGGEAGGFKPDVNLAMGGWPDPSEGQMDGRMYTKISKSNFAPLRKTV
jgi:hypothetical protein